LDDLILNEEQASDFLDNNNLDGYSSAVERTKVDEIPLALNMLQQSNGDNGHFDLSLEHQMVRLVTNEDDKDLFVGCVLKSNLGQTLYRFLFNSPLECPEASSFKGNCRHMIALPEDDGKMITCMAGLSTCGVKYPCPRCLFVLGTSSSYPTWMTEQFPTYFSGTNEPTSHDFLLREGRYSKEATFQNYETAMGKNRMFSVSEDNVSKNVRESCKSVVQEPVLSMGLDCHSGDPMHLNQGYMTHLTEETLKQLSDVAGGSGWAEQRKEEVLAITREEAALAQSNAFKNTKSAYASLDSTVKRCLKKLEKARDDALLPNMIARLETELDDAKSEREYFARGSRYTQMTARIRGGKECIDLVEGKKKSKLGQLNQAEFVFLRAIRTFAGGFNKQHGQIKLTNAHGIKALERRKDIHDFVCSLYEISNPICSAEVKKIMEWWL
jgi:hypothetical protein